jgi:phosphoenolpyruvate carboxylase
MEVRIVIFLAFTSVTVVTNTVVILLAYKAFANLTSRATQTFSDIRKSTEAREWIDSLRVAAERAAVVTETTKRKLAEFTPILGRAQEDYRRTLVAIDSKLETTAEKITTTARGVRDTIAKPAFSVATFAAGLTKDLDRVETED